MAFPPVLFSILLIAVLGPGLTSIVIAIVVIDWTRFARVVRAEAMAQGAMDYPASAQVAGRTRLSTMLVEILPNVLPTIVVLADAGNGHRGDRRGDPVFREPVDLDGRSDLGRHDLRGAHVDPPGVVGHGLPAGRPVLSPSCPSRSSARG
jgi:hypothetical protein